MERSQEKLTNNNNNNNNDNNDDDDYEQYDNVVKKLIIRNYLHLYDVCRVKFPSSSKAGFHVFFFSFRYRLKK